MDKSSKGVQVRQASVYYLVGSLFSKGITFLTVPIFTRILSTTDYGIINTYTSWVAILSVVLGFALHMSIRASFVDYQGKEKDFLNVTLTFSLIVGIAVSTAAVLIFCLLHVNVSLLLVLLCLLQSVSSAIIEDFSMYLMMQYEYKKRTAIMVLPNMISSILAIGAIMFMVKENAYLGRIVPTCIVYILFAFSILILVYGKNRPCLKGEYISYGLKISLPLVLHGIALSILSQSDRMMITEFVGPDQTGIYSLIYNFGMIATVATTALDGVWVPWFYKHYNKRDYESVNKKVVIYVQTITFFLIGLILVGPEIVKILTPSEYWEGVSIIPPVVLSSYVVFLYTLYVNVEHYHKKTVQITVNTIIAATVNIILNLIFIPKYGYVAAAYTTLAAYLASFVIHAMSVKRLDAKIYPVRSFAGSLLQNFAAVIIFYVFQDIWAVRWGLAFVYMVCLAFFYRKELNRIFPFLGCTNHKGKSE